MLTLDGSAGEGGGQILRTALALSLATSAPFELRAIRAGRKKPGLMRQHLAAVRAAAEVGAAEVSGDELGSRTLVFRPTTVAHGERRFAVGSAGSTTLVLQTVLPALLTTPGVSTLVLEGGTHNPMAPPFDFVDRAFLPLLRRLGARVTATLERHGFYPAGGGRMHVTVEGGPRLAPLELLEPGRCVATRLTALVAQIPGSIALREIDAFLSEVPWPRSAAKPLVVAGSSGPGNALIAEVSSEHVTEVFTSFGERGVPAEAVAKRLASSVARYLSAGVPVGEHLADQLLLPMALGGGGRFRTTTPSAHTRTQIDVLRAFVGMDTNVTQRGADDFILAVTPG